jgi:hypothetical protein
MNYLADLEAEWVKLADIHEKYKMQEKKLIIALRDPYDLIMHDKYLEDLHYEMYGIMLRIHDTNVLIDTARNQVIIQKVKEDLRKETPKEYVEHTVALTVSPADRETHHACLQVVEIVKQLSCVQKMKWCYEQTSTDAEDGWHIHMQIWTTYAPSKVKQFAQQKVSRAGYKATYISKPSDNRWLDNYMQGYKFNQTKDAGVAQTLKLREKYGLQDLYEYEKKI